MAFKNVIVHSLIPQRGVAGDVWFARDTRKVYGVVAEDGSGSGPVVELSSVRMGADGKDGAPGAQGPRGDVLIPNESELAAAVIALRQRIARIQAAHLVEIERSRSLDPSTRAHIRNVLERVRREIL
jgi:hypothetical protein